MKLTHIDNHGRASMVNVSGKPRVRRKAEACGKVFMQGGTLRLIRENLVEKGDVLSVARIGGIQAAKKTYELIPLCHQIEIDHVEINFELDKDGIKINATATCTDRTGIEMEALTAVSVAALTIYDMCKAVDREMVIGEIFLLQKTKEAVGEEQG